MEGASRGPPTDLNSTDVKQIKLPLIIARASENVKLPGLSVEHLVTRCIVVCLFVVKNENCLMARAEKGASYSRPVLSARPRLHLKRAAVGLLESLVSWGWRFLNMVDLVLPYMQIPTLKIHAGISDSAVAAG